MAEPGKKPITEHLEDMLSESVTADWDWTQISDGWQARYTLMRLLEQAEKSGAGLWFVTTRVDDELRVVGCTFGGPHSKAHACFIVHAHNWMREVLDCFKPKWRYLDVMGSVIRAVAEMQRKGG